MNQDQNHEIVDYAVDQAVDFTLHALEKPVADTTPTVEIIDTAPTTVAQDWLYTAASSDGRRVVAIGNNGDVSTSNDAGATWTERTRLQNYPWVNLKYDEKTGLWYYEDDEDPSSIRNVELNAALNKEVEPFVNSTIVPLDPPEPEHVIELERVDVSEIPEGVRIINMDPAQKAKLEAEQAAELARRDAYNQAIKDEIAAYRAQSEKLHTSVIKKQLNIQRHHLEQLTPEKNHALSMLKSGAKNGAYIPGGRIYANKIEEFLKTQRRVKILRDLLDERSKAKRVKNSYERKSCTE